MDTALCATSDSKLPEFPCLVETFPCFFGIVQRPEIKNKN